MPKKKEPKKEEQVILDPEATEDLEKKSVPESPVEVEEEVNDRAKKQASKGENPLQVLKDELDEYKDKYLRLYSEFENFRRRTNKEKYDTIAQANERLLADLLPVIDDFDRANKALKASSDKEAWEKGIELIFQKLNNVIGQKGVKKMEALSKDFDPELHEAITQIPAPEKKLKGKVVDVIEEGYFLNDKVLRFAKVVVGQ